MAFAVTIAIMIAKVSADRHEDGDPLGTLSININKKFEELFQRLDRLELEVKRNRCCGKGNDQTGNVDSGGAIIDDEANNGEANLGGAVHPTPGSNETHMNEVKRLQRILSDGKFFPTFFSYFRYFKIHGPVLAAEKLWPSFHVKRGA